jgi:hypothetical protein
MLVGNHASNADMPAVITPRTYTCAQNESVDHPSACRGSGSASAE